jgi:hypothetical protein
LVCWRILKESRLRLSKLSAGVRWALDKGSRGHPANAISEIPVHNFGWVFHKKLLARAVGCCIVVSLILTDTTNGTAS